MLVGDPVLLGHREHALEKRLRKTLSPDLCRDRLRQVEGELGCVKLAVRFERVAQCRGREPLPRDTLELLAEARQICLGKAQSGRCRMSAEARDRTGRALGDKVESSAQMEAGMAELRNGAPTSECSPFI
jgi:hypothetical protein